MIAKSITAQHSLRPILLSVAEAHRKRYIQYDTGSVATLSCPELTQRLGVDSAVVPPEKQFPLTFATLTDLGKALSSSANSPVRDGTSLRQRFDTAFAEYLQLLQQAQDQGATEPDYGTYVYDVVTGNLFVVAPEEWHRIALATSTGMLLTDPPQALDWHQVRAQLECKTVGFIGASVGGNLIEGVMREVRPKMAKVADPDWIETNNLNRLERGSIEYLAQSRASRMTLANAYELQRWNKAELAAYRQQLVDPYSEWFVYKEGLTEENIEQFFLGDAKHEPKIDLVVEEADDLPLKVLVRKFCRKHRIPVLMLSDFGHCAIMQFWDFAQNPDLSLGFECSDQELDAAVDAAMTSGNRSDVFKLIELMCGPDFARDEFAAWVAGTGEQPTSSLPQSGATALISGGIGGKTIARYFLGHSVPRYRMYDFASGEVITKD